MIGFSVVCPLVPPLLKIIRMHPMASSSRFYMGPVYSSSHPVVWPIVWMEGNAPTSLPFPFTKVFLWSFTIVLFGTQQLTTNVSNAHVVRRPWTFFKNKNKILLAFQTSMNVTANPNPDAAADGTCGRWVDLSTKDRDVEILPCGHFSLSQWTLKKKVWTLFSLLNM